MRTHSLAPVLPLVLLGCTFHTYPAHTLPPAGFGTESAPAAQSAGWGGRVEAARPTAAHAPRQVHLVGNESRGTRPSTRKGVVPVSAASETAQASASSGKPSPVGSSKPSPAASNEPSPASGSATLADAAGRSRPAAPPPAQKPAPRAQPTRRTVMLARSPSSSDSGKSALDARLRQSSARGARGTPLATQAKEPERAGSATARALAAMKDPDSSADGRMRLRDDGSHASHDHTHDASGTAQLAQGARSEHVHRADELEKLATK